MKGIFLGPVGSAAKWAENGLQMIERWINTLIAFRGATADADGADGLVPQPKAGDQTKFLCGDGTFKLTPTGGVADTGEPGTVPVYDEDGNVSSDADFTYDPDNNILYSQNVVVEDVPFDDSWDGDDSVPTKNAIYDLVASGAASSMSPFFTPTPKNVGVPGTGETFFDVLVPGCTISSTGQVVWVMATVSGSYKTPRKVSNQANWTLEIMLRRGASMIRMAGFTFKLPVNQKNTFEQQLLGGKAGLTPGDYDVVLRSSRSGISTPGEVTVNMLGMVMQ